MLSQPHYPGWRAVLDGKPAVIEVWDGLLQAVRRPARTGDGDFVPLEASFTPSHWVLLAGVSLAAWALWACTRRGDWA